MRISFENYRRFAATPEVPLRKLTLLVGENSSGKTSFLAGLRFAHDFLSMSTPSFNKAPFFLGSVDEVLRRSASKKEGSTEFSFEVANEPGDLENDRIAGGEQRRVERRIKVTFAARRGIIALSELTHSVGKSSLRFLTREGLQFEISNGKKKWIGKPKSPRAFDTERLAFQLPHIYSLIASMRIGVGELKAGKRTATTRDDISWVSGGRLPRHISLANEMVDDLVQSQWLFGRKVFAYGPIRSAPERAYSYLDIGQATDGRHVPFDLARLSAMKDNDAKLLFEGINEFGKDSGLFDSIHVHGNKRSFGGSFEILVRNMRMKSNIADVGYGVSQILPIVADSIRFRHSTFLLQQPEVHLHPRAQAALGTFLGKLTKAGQRRFVVETHSDFLVDRIRSDIARGDIDPSNVALLYFARTPDGTVVSHIEIDKSGNLLSVPSGFRDFFVKEDIRLLTSGAN